MLPRHAMVAWSMLSHTQYVSCCAFVACCASLHVAARASCCSWIVAVPRRRSISSSRSARSCVRTNVTPLLVTDHNMRQRCAVHCAIMRAVCCLSHALCRIGARAVPCGATHACIVDRGRLLAQLQRRLRERRLELDHRSRACRSACGRSRPAVYAACAIIRGCAVAMGYSAMGHSYNVPQ